MAVISTSLASPRTMTTVVVTPSGQTVSMQIATNSTVVTSQATVEINRYTFADGMDEGDLIRWNADEGAWEVKSEPFEFQQIILTPREEALLNQEGALWYKSTEKAVFVCTDDV